MTIALIAHDSKKELMAQFCIAYKFILSEHILCATGTTAKVVSEATDLRIHKYLSGQQGGIQQVTSRISCNEIDILFFFRDNMKSQREINLRENINTDEIDILRMCDVHNIPMATNIATGEALILALKRGDLDWRNMGGVDI
jgi:methylglyoxal synthase